MTLAPGIAEKTLAVLDLMILEAFSNLNDSVTLIFTTLQARKLPSCHGHCLKNKSELLRNCQSAAMRWNVGQHIHFVTEEQNAGAPKLEASRQIALT